MTQNKYCIYKTNDEGYPEIVDTFTTKKLAKEALLKIKNKYSTKRYHTFLTNEKDGCLVVKKFTYAVVTSYKISEIKISEINNINKIVIIEEKELQ